MSWFSKMAIRALENHREEVVPDSVTTVMGSGDMHYTYRDGTSVTHSIASLSPGRKPVDDARMAVHVAVALQAPQSVRNAAYAQLDEALRNEPVLDAERNRAVAHSAWLQGINAPVGQLVWEGAK